MLSMQNYISRRKILSIIASSMCFIPIKSYSSNKYLHHYIWKSSAFGNPVEIKLYSTEIKNLTETLTLILDEIKRLENIFYLQNAKSSINILNSEKILLNPDIDLVNAIYLSEQFHNISESYFDITVQPLWNYFSSGKKTNLEGIGFKNISFSRKKISLLNRNTEITLNSVVQGILTDRVNEILLNANFENHLINFGEGKAAGLAPSKNKWLLHNGDKILDISNKGFAISEAKSTVLPNNKSHLFNALTKNIAVDAPDKTTVIAPTSTIADVISTTYSVSNKYIQKKLINSFKDVTIYVN